MRPSRWILRPRVSSLGFDDATWMPFADLVRAGGQEHERGLLAPGLRADLVILDGTLNPDQPPTVSETWVAGRRCYTA